MGNGKSASLPKEAWLNGVFRWYWPVLGATLPLSVRVFLPWSGVELIFPAEPLVAIGVILIAWEQMRSNRSIRSLLAFRPHVLDVAVFAFLLGSIIAAAAAEHHLVAWKVVVVQVAYILVFYVAFRSRGPSISSDLMRAWRWYAFAFLFVVLWAMVKEGLHGLDREASDHAAFPFFLDHTSYGAALCFMLPFFAMEIGRDGLKGGLRSRKVFYLLLTLVILVALLLSYSRGAWMGAAAAGSGLIIARWRTPAHRLAALVLLFIVFAGSTLWLSGRPAVTRPQGERTGLWRSLASMTDLRTVPSNLDRIVRWRAAWSMFQESPITGQGPGAYPIVLPEHLSNTGASGPERVDPEAGPYRPWPLGGKVFEVRADPVRDPSSGGSAHSEYLLALSEGGLLLFLPWALLSLTLLIGQVLIDPCRHPMVRMVTFGIVAYLVHGLVNNFLDDAKLAFLFWSGAALIATYDLRRGHPARPEGPDHADH